MAAIDLALIVLAVSAAQVDSDGDGAADLQDAYPCDATASAQAFAPSSGNHALLLFEDQWPARGDLDFNDVALGWTTVLRLDAQGRAVAVRMSFDPLALGGRLDHGLGLHLPVPRDALASITRSIDGGAPESLAITADAEITARVSPNLRELFGNLAGQINSTSHDPRQAGAILTVDVTFSRPVALAAAGAPYDTFIFRSAENGHEIHRPEFGGTASMTRALFGTEDDGSTASRHFVDDSGLPFALVIPQNTAYPAEAIEIAQLYPRIVDFAASAGASARDFYTTPVASAAYADVNGAGGLTPRFLGERIPDACNECPSGHCVAPSCTDGVRNGDERQIDCGGACAIPEQCNGVDDDCSGVADDGNPGGGNACNTGALGACATGTTRCTSGAIQCSTTVTAVAETCNGVDDDCDGSVDEGACVTADDMNGNSGLWVSEVAYGSAWSASWSGGFMTIAAPNNTLVRARSTNTLSGNFEIRLTGRAFWNGNTLATHIKPFVGLYHTGSTTNVALQHRAFFDNSAVYGGETHYGVDINALLGAASGATRSFNLRWVKIGNTVQIYSTTGTTETLRSTLTITNPAAALRFEAIHIDGTSGGNGHIQLDRYELTQLN